MNMAWTRVLEKNFRASVSLFYTDGVTETDRKQGINTLVKGCDLPIERVAVILDELTPKKKVYPSIH